LFVALVAGSFADCCLLALSANNRFWGKSGSRFLQYDSVTILRGSSNQIAN